MVEFMKWFKKDYKTPKDFIKSILKKSQKEIKKMSKKVLLADIVKEYYYHLLLSTYLKQTIDDNKNNDWVEIIKVLDELAKDYEIMREVMKECVLKK